jgi:hypothetical protein
MTKHTKGPWDLSNTKTRIIGIKPAPETPDERGNRLAQVIFSYTPDNRDYPACQIELEANARLIAAAPDLFYQLKTAIHLLKQCDEFRGGANIKLMEEAVNKAKGVI